MNSATAEGRYGLATMFIGCGSGHLRRRGDLAIATYDPVGVEPPSRRVVNLASSRLSDRMVVERVEDRYTQGLEVSHVAGDHRQPIGNGDSGDHGILDQRV